LSTRTSGWVASVGLDALDGSEEAFGGKIDDLAGIVGAWVVVVANDGIRCAISSITRSGVADVSGSTESAVGAVSSAQIADVRCAKITIVTGNRNLLAS